MMRRALPWLALVLAVAVGLDAARTFPTQVGIDFYHLWGVPMGQRASAVALSPYANTADYAALLNVLADNSTSEALRAANRFKREIAPTGTPLFYAAFGFLPDDYASAHTLFAFLQYLAAAAAIWILARSRGATPWAAACIALAVELTFNPFVQDVKWGNATTFQLLFLALCLRASAAGTLSREGWPSRLFLPSLVVFVLFKPNTVAIAAMLAFHYAALRGSRAALRSVAWALPAAAIAWALGAWYFGNAAIWSEWLAYARGGALVYRFGEGNQSWPMLLAELAPMHGAGFYAAMVLVLGAAALAAGLARNGVFAARAAALLRDPWCAASIGVLFTLAASPLVWPYYHLFAIIPMAWLFRADGRWDGPSWCALAAYAALSSPVLAVFVAMEQYAVLRWLMFLSWLPLVPATTWRARAILAATRATTAASAPAAR
jgi:hypothetical protein